MNAVAKAAINLDLRNRSTTWVEDIEVKLNGRTTWFSVEVDHDLDVDRNVRAVAVMYDGKPIGLPPSVVNLIELAIEDDRR